MTSQSRFVCLTETVPRIDNSERSVLLCRDLDPVCRTVMRRRWRRVRAGLWRWYRSDRYCGWGFIDSVGDEETGHGVFLPAQLREVDLPESFEAWRGMHRLHHFGLAAFPRAVVHDCNTWMESMNDDFRIRSGLTVVKTQKDVHCADAIHRAHQLEFLVLRQIA